MAITWKDTSRITWVEVEPDEIKIAKLVSSMTKRYPITITPIGEATHFGVVNMIEVEDGSGYKFNITLCNFNTHTSETFFVDIRRSSIQFVA